MLMDELLELSPYSLHPEEKEERLRAAMQEAAVYHYDHCEKYRQWLQKQHFDPHQGIRALKDLPFLPVQVFKNGLLLSVPSEQIRNTIQSSATTGVPSRVAVDALTSRRQTRAVIRVLADYLGSQRRPFVILDLDPKAHQDAALTARMSTVRAFLNFASSATYVMRTDEAGSPPCEGGGRGGSLSLDLEALDTVLRDLERSEEPFCLLGFTFILYAHVVKPLLESNRTYCLPRALALHIGGWKKLQSESVSRGRFNQDTARFLGMSQERVLDVYGFSEQGGLLYPDCSQGYKHAPAFAEVFIRNPQTLAVQPDGEEGLVQVLTPLPHSYPGISIITEDVGVVRGRGQCACGRIGTAFQILGRARQSETRGCGDILAEKVRR